MGSKSATTRCAILTACIVALISTPGVSCAPSDAPSIPQLVVLIVIDQLPASHLERFAPYFGQDGFQRLIREGRLFSDARFAHNTTTTAPGHTVIGTGRYGDSTGIVGNSWFSPAGFAVYSADGPVRASDPTQCARADSPSRAASAPRNPCNLEGTSLARRVKSRWPKARLVGASIKDRSAILALGEDADAVYWFDPGLHPRFTSSAYYRPDAARLERLNAAVLPAYLSSIDRPAETTPETFAWQFGLEQARAAVCPDDDVSAHAAVADLRATFPHRVSSLATLIYTPYGDDLLADFAKALVADLDLGRNPAGQPDVLLLGFSSSDMVGHLFGPDSCEVADTMARLDATLAGLVRFLDERVPRERSVIVLTSDHGVGSAPEVLRRRGQAGGRVFFDNEGALNVGQLPPPRQALEKALAAELGMPVAPSTPVGDAVVRTVAEPFLYLNPKRAGAAGMPALRARVKTQVEALEGIAAAYTLEEIEGGKAPESVRRGFRAGRSGDVVVVLKPGFIFDQSAARVAASHGQPYDYDAQVPVIVRGSGIDAATIREQVDMARVAPTVARLLDLDARGFAVPQPLPLSGAARDGRSTASTGKRSPEKSGG